MTSRLPIERRDEIAIVRLAHPPVNALSAQVREELFAALASLRDDPGVRAVVIAGQGRAFSAGADVGEFQAAPGAFADRRDPADITASIEAFGKPVVAAIHGFALGGGLELALGCHWRIAARGSRLGLPEVALGILPGAGGTQRLPRLVGVRKALWMMTTGEPVDADAGAQMGLVDAVSDDEVVDAAMAFLRERLSRRQPIRVTGATSVPLEGDEEQAIAEVRSTLGVPPARRRAAGRIIDCVEAATRLAFEDGMRYERAAFMECLRSPEAAALQHVFFAQRAAGRDGSNAEPRPVRSVGIVGGGSMGRGIAIAFANADFTVSLMEISAEKARAAVTAITAEYTRLAERGRLTPGEAQARSARISAISAPEELRGCDLVIEAVFEDMSIKLQTAALLGQHCRPGAVIASNTSTLDIDRLAQASGRPQDFVGLHFFSPANIMRLVEVIRGKETSDAALSTAVAVARAIHKVPVVCGVCWGFIGNRMLEPYLREAEALLLEGALPSQIDKALENFGMAMGPCRMMDLAGVDVVAKVVAARALEGMLPNDPRYRIVARHLAELGRHGQKSGEGFYRYDGRKAIDDHDASALIDSLARRHGTVRRTDISEREIVERCILPLINEGYRILEEGVASRDSDIDVVWLTGYGFPEALGGPMFYGAQLGFRTLVERLHHYADTLGNRWGYWTPAGSPGRSSASDKQLQNPGVSA